MKQHIAGAEAAFPRDEMITEGDKVVVRFAMRATHQGDFMDISPTGRPINAPGIIIYRVDDDKVVEHWMQFDVMALMQQLGVQPG